MDPGWLSNAYLVADSPAARRFSSTRGAARAAAVGRRARGARRRTCSRPTRHADHVANHQLLEDRYGLRVLAAPDEGIDGAEHPATRDRRGRRSPGRGAAHARAHPTTVSGVRRQRGRPSSPATRSSRGSVGGGAEGFDDLRRSVMDVLMGLPHELAAFSGPHARRRRSGASGTRTRSSASGAASTRRGRSACTWTGRRRRSSSGRPTTTAGARRWVRFARRPRRRSSAARALQGCLMAGLVPEKIEQYAEANTTPPDELLRRLAEETRATLRAPQMLTGAVEGRLLEFLVFALRPQRVLELGTYSGYSSLSMAAGAPAGRPHRHLRDRRDARRRSRAATRAQRRTPTASPSTSARRSRRSSGSRASTTSSSSTPTRRTTRPTTRRSCPRLAAARADGARQHALGGRVRRRRRRRRDARRSSSSTTASPPTRASWPCMLTVRDGVTLVRRAG